MRTTTTRHITTVAKQKLLAQAASEIRSTIKLRGVVCAMFVKWCIEEHNTTGITEQIMSLITTKKFKDRISLQKMNSIKGFLELYLKEIETDTIADDVAKNDVLD